MQTTNEMIHIKAALNNEFRRFSMEKANYKELVDLIRTLYSLPANSNLKICFIDDEQDMVLISSDNEFRYAADLVRPLKLVITTVSIPLVPLAIVEPCQATSTEVEKPSRCGGKAQKNGCEERKKWREEMQSLTKEQRILVKTTWIKERIQHIEALLLTDLPAHRHRALSWKLEKLQMKLGFLQSLAEVPAVPAVPTTTTPEEPERRGWCGRGGRGGCQGRGAFENQAPEEGCRKQWGPFDKQIWHCRQELRAAREAGNQSEIERCSKALDEARLLKWDAKREEKPQQPRNFCEAKYRKRECMKNLREAKASGDPEKINECVNALIEAREAWQKAKASKKC